MLLRVAQSATPFAPWGGISLCDARDVAAGVRAALEKGETGRRYILAGHNMSYVQAWRLFAKVARSRGPLCPAGPLMRIVAGAWGDLWALATGKEGDVNSASVRLSGYYHYYASARAERELGYRIRPAGQTVQDAWQWFVDHHYARQR
jgi:dihydroflavonol-4-reductase